MEMSKKFIRFVFCFFFVFKTICTLFANEIQDDTTLVLEKNLSEAILSPVSGTWANCQSLVLDVPKDYIVLYSFTGEDPLSFGFAYDEAVLIEKDGAVDLRIVFVSSNGENYEFRRNYEVAIESKQDFLQNEKEFLNQNQALIRLDADNALDIPVRFSYSLSDSYLPQANGRKLVLGENDIERYLPLIVEAENKLYRWMLFISKTKPSNSSAKINESENQSSKIILSNPDFQFRLSGKDDSPLLDCLFVSVLQGEVFSKNILVDVFYYDKFQGRLEKSIYINKAIPKKPTIISSTSDFLSRETVNIKIEELNTLYYLVDEPEELGFDKKTGSYIIEDKKIPSIDELKKGTKTKSLALEFQSHSQPVLYCIYAMLEDADGNYSDVASYSCIVDSTNYFIDSQKKNESLSFKPDGSPNFPFSSLSEAFNNLSQKDFAQLHLLTNDTIDEVLYIKKDFNIIAYNDAQVFFGPQARFVLENAKLAFYNLFFVYDEKLTQSKKLKSDFQQAFFSLQNANLLFENSDFYFSQIEISSFIQGRKSRLDFFHSSFVLQSSFQANFLSVFDSEINVLSSIISLSAPQSLIFSLFNTNLNLYKSKFICSGEQNKFADLINAPYFFVSNSFFSTSNESQIQEQGLKLMLDIPKDLFFIDYKSKQKEFLDNRILIY